MPLPGIDPEIAMPAAAEDRRARGRHRTEARPVGRSFVIAGLRKQLARDPQHSGEVRRLVRGVVAGELGNAGQPEAVAHPAPGDEIALVDAADFGRAVAAGDRYRRRVALD